VKLYKQAKLAQQKQEERQKKKKKLIRKQPINKMANPTNVSI